MLHANISQQQSGNSKQPSHEIQEEEDETIPTPTSKKPGSWRKRVKKMATRNVDPEPEPQAEVVNVRNFWSQEEELLLAELYNDQAGKRGFPIRTKNMLTGKWTPMNRDVGKFNSLVNETKAMSGDNDDNLMTRIKILYRAHTKSDLSTRVLETF
ncbi:hypothetical protein Tco_1333885 [Tanacetum coccineum]